MTRPRVLCAGLVAVIAGCTPWYDREFCLTRTVEEARQQVSASLPTAASIGILECFVIPKTESVHGCVLRIDPKDFPTLFTTLKFSAEEPPPDPKKSYSTAVAARHGFGIAGMVTAVDNDYRKSLRLLYNASLDRVIVLISERECHTPSQVIS